MKNRLTLLTLLCFMSLNAEALELAFYTYGGFQETVSAFHRIALIFNDDRFTWIFHLFAVAGVFIGYAIYNGNQVLNAGDGQAKPSLRIILTVALGIAIYQGTIISKGEIWVIDEQNGREQKIDNVPDILVLAAGFTNKTERLVSRVLEDNPATLNQGYSDGLNFRLLYDAVSNTSSFKQFYAVKSLQRFYKDCSLIPLNTNGNTFNIETIKSDTKDIFGYLGNLESTSVYTVHYTNTNKAGETVSCRTAYKRLQGVFDNGSSYDDYLKTICKSNAFDVNDPIQLGRCTDAMTSSVQSVYGNTELDYMGLMKNYLVGMAITDALQQENPDNGTIALSNRAMINEGVGTAVAAGKWLPTIRSVITAIILSLTPILLLFVVTGLAWKALKIVFSLFAWVALWGVCDTLLQQSIIDQTQATFAEIVNHDMGLTAIMLTPGAAMKSLAILGEARGMGITIASFIAVSLFGLNAYAFSQIGQNFTNQVNKHGENASNQASNAEQSGQLSEQIVNGNSYLASMSSVTGGYGTAMESATFNQAQSMLTGSMSSRALSGNPIDSATRTARSNALTNTQSTRQGEMLVESLGGPNESIAVTADRMANVGAGSTVGNIQATEDATRLGNTSFDTARDTAHTDTSSRIGSATGTREAANKLGMSVVDKAAIIQEQNSIRDFGEANTFKRMMDDYIKQNPSASYAGSSEAIATVKNSGVIGKLRASDGNPEPHINTAETESRFSISEWKSLRNEMDSNGSSVEQAGETTGQIKSASLRADKAVLESKGAEGFYNNQVDTRLSSISKSEEKVDYANAKYDGDLEEFNKQLAQYGMLTEAAEMRRFNAISEQAEIDPVILAHAKHGSGYNLTPELADRFYEKGVIQTEDQYKSLQNGGYYSINQYDENIVTSSAHSGNNSTSDSSNVHNTQRTIMSGDYIGGGTSGLVYFTSDEHRDDRLIDANRILSGDDSARVMWIQTATDTLSSILNTTRLSTETQSGNLGFGTPGGLPINAGVGIAHQDTENTSYDVIRAAASKVLDGAVHWVNNELPPESRAEMLDNKFQSVFNSMYESFEQSAKESTQGVDINSDISMIMDRHGIPYNHLDIDTTQNGSESLPPALKDGYRRYFNR